MTYQNSNSGQAERMRTGSSKTAARIQIVVADDHPIVREGVLQPQGRERHLKVIGEANDGTELWSHQQTTRYRLLDLRMPRMNGWKVPTGLNELKLPIRASYDRFRNEEDIQVNEGCGASVFA